MRSKRLTAEQIARKVQLLPSADITHFIVDNYVGGYNLLVQECNQGGKYTRNVFVRNKEIALRCEQLLKQAKILVTVVLACLLVAFSSPAWADSTDEPVELVSSVRKGWKYHNFKKLQIFGPKEYTYRTSGGKNFITLEHIKELPDRRPSEQRHPIESTGLRILNWSCGIFNLLR